MIVPVAMIIFTRNNIIAGLTSKDMTTVVHYSKTLLGLSLHQYACYYFVKLLVSLLINVVLFSLSNVSGLKKHNPHTKKIFEM